MSKKKKRKPQVIHVKKVIIKADEVIIEDHGKKHRDEEPERRDPWGFFGSKSSDGNPDEVESDDKEKKDENEASEEENDRPEGGFSWF
ncbi:hypothetical protein [Guptibacillus algicola]|uniref:hypothetical protein n=1 Tax=Guptibacillus algicola TaxID=225844 RepID=UPI001CD4F903|nr:hypothetical protein [Alkalihalobacillus algicola]MCA0987866.1 hypothetical protein [Alkalihalobacillus algicola]